MSFESDKNEQRSNELMLACAMARSKKALVWPNGNGKDSAKDFTLFVPTLVEVKWDKKAEKTGNFYFEIFNTKTNQPSGLASTKAMLWYHFVPPNRLFSCDPKYALSAIEGLVRNGQARLVEGGDDNSRGILVSIETALATGMFQQENFIP